MSRHSLQWVFLPVAILSILAGLLVSTARRTSLAYDEVIYAPIGVLYWKTGDFRWNREHPPLQKLVSALPLLSQNLKLPEDIDPLRDDPWHVGHRIFFHNENPIRLIFLSRLPSIIATLALALLIFLWAFRRFGPAPAVLSLAAFSFDPLVLGNGALAMNDIFLTLFFFASVLAFERKWPVLAGVMAGLAISSKLSGLLLVPLFFAVAGARWSDRRNRKHALKEIALPLVAAFVTVLIVYRFDVSLLFSAFHKEAAIRQGNQQVGYLLGPVSGSATWYWYPVAAFIKTPVPLMILWGLGTWALLKKRSAIKNPAYILAPVALLWAAALLSRNHFGLRYLLPATPFLALLAGASYAAIVKKESRLAARALAAWMLLEVALVHPHHMAYFNELIGGIDKGYQWLDGSNQDWGQDLPALADYLKKTAPEAGVLMGYWGSNDPAAWGIQYQDVLSPAIVNRHRADVMLPPNVPKELLVVSSTLLRNSSTRAAYAWLDGMQPVSLIGGTLFVYDITRDGDAVRKIGEIYRAMGRTALARRQAERAKIVGG